MLVAGLVSGGQSGVDRAALVVGRELGIRVAGWCPAGGWAEDLPDVRALFPELRATESADPAERTRLNVLEADAVLVLDRPDVESPGTALTLRLAVHSGKPHLYADVAHPLVVREWLMSLDRPVLDVAGPRESEAPGIQAEAEALLRVALR